MNNQTKKNATLPTVQKLHLAMMLAQLLALAVAIFMVWRIGPLHASESLNRISQVVLIVIGLPLVIIGVKQYQRTLLKLRKAGDPSANTSTSFKKSFMIMLAAVEATTVLCLIAYLFSGNNSLLVLVAMLLIFFASLHPSKSKMMLLLGYKESVLADW